MKIVVIGGSGLFGTKLVERLRRGRHEKRGTVELKEKGCRTTYWLSDAGMGGP
jgi:nucleoside-diphosphate-sugar epimerase